jgi:diguanylate cyclase (GGDEF)-like protein
MQSSVAMAAGSVGQTVEMAVSDEPEANVTVPAIAALASPVTAADLLAQLFSATTDLVMICTLPQWSVVLANPAAAIRFGIPPNGPPRPPRNSDLVGESTQAEQPNSLVTARGSDTVEPKDSVEESDSVENPVRRRKRGSRGGRSRGLRERPAEIALPIAIGDTTPGPPPGQGMPQLPPEPLVLFEPTPVGVPNGPVRRTGRRRRGSRGGRIRGRGIQRRLLKNLLPIDFDAPVPGWPDPLSLSELLDREVTVNLGVTGENSRREAIEMSVVLVPLTSKEGKVDHVAVCARDASGDQLFSQQNESLADLRTAAYVDDLTGLGTKISFNNQLSFAREEDDVTLAFIDLNRFKAINDVHGHAGGDAALKAVGASLIGVASQSSGRAFRWGGDEFACMWNGAQDIEFIDAIGQRLLGAIGAAGVAAGRELGVEDLDLGAAIGFAVGDLDTDDDALLTKADDAMYLAKESGQDTWRIADSQ